MQIDISSLETLLQQADKLVLVGHFNPDGDALGSVTAAYHYLKGRGKHPRIILPSPYPDNMAFLEPEDPRDRMMICENELDDTRRAVAEADAIICLDLNRLARTEYLEDDILAAPGKKVLIDHHIPAELDRFDVAISTTGVSSTCELLFWILMALPDVAGDPQRISARCAESLYVGMMTDTNNFSNSVLPGTFEMASKLIARGVDKNGLQEKVLSCYSVSRTRLMGHMIKDKMKVLPAYKTAYMLLSNKEKARYNFKPGDSEGFVNLPLAISSVQVSALFTENFDSKYIRVSLRSKGQIDVNRFATQFFNGGGHHNAAGGRLYMPLEAVPAYFEQSLATWAKEEKFL
ncbi:MAG: DHH family phosphoesterase [Bacteroidales bacterium]|nr:DHH family phosphoesterase [Bacteroidales bacterium]